MSGDDRQAHGRDTDALIELITAGWKSQAVRAAAELGIADLLAEGPMTAAQLATAAHAHRPFLHRLLRALTTIGVVVENGDGTFELTPMGALLPSLTSWTTWWGRYAWPEWAHLVDSLQTGQSARVLLSGERGFSAVEADPERAAVFNSAMAELTRVEAAGMVENYDFSGFGRIVDVGGGYGEVLVAILSACPQAAGVVFDLAHCAEGAHRHIVEAGLEDRCEVVTGDFFEAVPAGADAYIVKSVVHDWDDSDAQRILESCRRATGAGSTLLLVERVMPERLGTSAADQSTARSDLQMLVAHGARERTAPEIAELLSRSGFRLEEVHPTGRGLTVHEAVPV